jgi:NADH dehydrogenase (ubiquinone) Fe-S protein 6
VPNVSKTNELPQGKQQEDDVLVHENVENAQKLRTMQEPNRATTWSRSQKTREAAMSGPRFEQTIVELQVSIYPLGAGRGVEGCIQI